MGKKVSINFLYLIGMALVVVGFCCPIFKIGPLTRTGFNFINFDKIGFSTIGALALFVAAIAGLVWSVLPLVGIKLPAEALVKTLAALVLVVGIIVLVVGFKQNKVLSAVLKPKTFFKSATYGFYLLAVGIIAAVVGRFCK